MKLLQGTLDMLILRAVAEEERHGYAIAESIADTTDGDIAVEDAALYKALHRLEARGSISSSWGTSESRRRAKFYRLTARGKRELEAETRRWYRYSDAIAKVLGPR